MKILLRRLLSFNFERKRASHRRRQAHREWVEATLRHQPSNAKHAKYVRATADDIREGP